MDSLLKGLVMNNYGGTRADTLVKLTLIFFISLLSFSIGTFIGKQLSDKHQAEYEDVLTDEDIKQLEDEFIKSRTECEKKKGV